MATSNIEIGYQVFTNEGGEECGAVRDVAPDGKPELLIYIENAGDFLVPLKAVASVHDAKVILDPERLDADLRDAIEHAHDAERRGV